MPEIRRPEATDSCPRQFFDRGKKTEVEAAILPDLARPDPIFIINILTYTNNVHDLIFSQVGSVVKATIFERSSRVRLPEKAIFDNTTKFIGNFLIYHT